MILIPEGFKIIIGNNMPILFGEPIQLRQIFSNLINNALEHHTKDDGTIWIHCREMNNHYEFCIEDDGPGIPKKYLEKIFTIYETLGNKGNLKTPGIGLSIIKKILKGVKGTLWVESIEGKGSKFYFTWPKNKEH